MEVFAPAKINLSLRVLRRREDGFHEIESLIVLISVFDKLELELREAGGLEFVCSDASLPTDETNLVVRAARLFCQTFGLEPNLRIELRKGIPHGAGLGGGSSDAAATLLALNRLFATEVPRETLLELAAALGSDVPFFIHESAALCRGRGELVTPTIFPHALPVLLIKPPFGVPTPWAYQQWRDSREIPGVRYDAQKFSWGELANDLERPVFEKYLFLAHFKTWLLAQSEVAGALLSGSGSTVFAILDDRESASALGSRIAAEFGTDLWCHLAETIPSR
jgi:4-diphosphocytidyl-2-C-methyl-D-erythritol kinase